MGNEDIYVALGLKAWKAQIERADKLFGSLSSEEVLREIAPGRNRLLYLWGHLTAIHDANEADPVKMKYGLPKFATDSTQTIKGMILTPLSSVNITAQVSELRSASPIGEKNGAR